MNEPYVNAALLEKVLTVRERTPEEIQLSEDINLSDLWSKAINFNEDEMIVCVCAALQKYPNLVYQVLAQDREELKRKGKRSNENCPNV